ncbi:MAG: phytoene desaturase family protein [Bacteroidia bacterium]|nr:phytoene desaturase family protein [Bacteroidia bacterium]
MAKKVILVGGGLGGLSAAIHLAAQGIPVTLFEKNVSLGGKAGEKWIGPYRFDTGPSVVTLPEVIESPFQAAGETLDAYLTLISIEPITHYFFADGRQLTVWRDPEKMQVALKGWGPPAYDRWQRFLQYSRRLYENAAPIFLYEPIHELGYLLRSPAFWRWKNLFLPIDPFRKMAAVNGRFFSDPALAQIANRYATYNGSDPYQAPATLNLIFWVENGIGAYYIQGGIYRLVEALEKLARKVGVEIYPDTPVRRIVTHKNHVVGVETDKGFWEAEVVVSNVDVRTTYESLLGKPPPSSVQMGEPSLSGLVFLWGVRWRSPLYHHNVFFSADYAREFSELFKEKRLPSDPTVYVAITARTDPTHAPPDGENWFVMINLPPQREPLSEAAIAELREKVVQRLQKSIGFSALYIQEEAVFTPAHWMELGSAYGSLYGTASNRWWSAFLRPPNRSRRYRGLYFAGGSAHPGGGIPLVLLSGRHVARLIADTHFPKGKNVEGKVCG